MIDDRAELIDELDRVTAEIEAAGAGTVAQLADATPEGLAAARAADDGEAHELEERRSGLEHTAGSLGAKLDAGGSEDAALAAEREAHARAGVIDGLERYAELSLAAAALRCDRAPPPPPAPGPAPQTRQRAVRRLSGGKMTGLTVVTTERQPYIMGVPPDNRQVPVQDMSAGSATSSSSPCGWPASSATSSTASRCPWCSTTCSQLDDVSARAALEILGARARQPRSSSHARRSSTSPVRPPPSRPAC